MTIPEDIKNILKTFPSVDKMIEKVKLDIDVQDTPRSITVEAIRCAIDRLRDCIIERNQDMDTTIDLIKEIGAESLVLERVKELIKKTLSFNLKPLINATGVVVHTNLGRSLLAKSVIANVIKISENYSNLEFNLSKGKRGSRYDCVADILCSLTGADSAMVVNNNAAAVFLALNTIAKDKKVLISRGELVEIGGSFRIPDVMAASGAILLEVGTTNRTHFYDYENAIKNNEIGLILKVHTSNYHIIGFTSSVPLKNLAELGFKHNILVMEDLGSGNFIDFEKYGFSKEPTIKESVNSGADIVTFSGDKLLGGPQAGIILGKKQIIDKLKKNPITRALRIDKLTLSALEATLKLYIDEVSAIKEIPTLRMLFSSINIIEKKAFEVYNYFQDLDSSYIKLEVIDCNSKIGGGTFPHLSIPSKALSIKIEDISPNRIEELMRLRSIPIIGRIEDDRFILDFRTVMEDEVSIIIEAIKEI
ncbi:MAG: L-seryl-tRNA(Sec) selenium transferase [Desulfobacterales bacterium]|nr:L-seryl-tRNA(Sec) selenium transferase [Desulfobacterales bacterium]